MMDWLPVETVVAATNDPVMIGQVRDWLELSDNSSDAKVIGLIKAATRYVEKQTGLRLFTQTVAMRRRCFADEMQLPTGPVQSIESITYLDGTGVIQTLTSSAYEAVLYGNRPVISLASGKSWPSILTSPAAVILTAVVGFGGINDQPEDIRLALMMLCAQWFDTRAAASEKAMSEIPNGVAALLADYSPSPLG
jgi:uncharacterized phiE125 gp8 family phage protein